MYSVLGTVKQSGQCHIMFSFKNSYWWSLNKKNQSLHCMRLSCCSVCFTNPKVTSFFKSCEEKRLLGVYMWYTCIHVDLL